MNTKYMKRIVLGIPLIALAVVFVGQNPIMFGFCQNIIGYETGAKYCSGSQIFPEVISLLVFWLSLSLLFFSLITYKMREEVFRAWWRFARWWVLVIIAVTLLLERAGSGGGIGIGGAVSAAFDILILGVLYAVLVIVSLIQIARVYFKAKR